MIGKPVSNSIEAFLDKAESHIDKGETKEAEKLFRSVLVVFPEDKRALEGIQKIQQREAANSSSKLAPTRDKLHEIIGLYNQGRFQEVIQKAEETVRNSAPNVMLFNLIGAAHSGLKNLDQAIDNFNKVLELNPQDGMAYFNIGTIFLEKRNFEAAIENYQNCLSINPSHAEAFDNMGSALKAQGNFTTAIEQFTQAINLKPNFAQAHYNLGIALHETGDPQAAIKSHRKACQIRPNYFKAYLGMGNAMKDKGELDTAIDSYKQAINIKPDYADAYYNMGNALKDKGELNTAIDSYKQAIKIKPDYADAYYNMGNVLEDKGELEQALENYQMSIKIEHNKAKLYYRIASIYYDFGDISLAQDNLEKANSIDPMDWTVKGVLLTKVALSKLNKYSVRSKGPNLIAGSEKCIATSIRPVENELIQSLYNIQTRKLDDTGLMDARHGNGICSDFNLFASDNLMLKKVSKDLTHLMEKTVGSKIFIDDSFFNILKAGGGTTPHVHLHEHDKDFEIGNDKYSLVYYLSVGDQKCTEPGILKIYGPDHDILPSKGMVTIIAANRSHSAVYNGKTDRVMIGVNFYAL